MLLRLPSLLLLLFSLLAVPAFAQKKKPKEPRSEPLTPAAFQQLEAIEDTIALLAYAVVNDSVEQVRFGACRTLITTLVRALKTENSFRYKFDRLKSVSILAPPDSSFRIFTWQLFVNDSTYRYYGAVQMNSPRLLLYALKDRSAEASQEAVYQQYSPDQWYGAVYYGLRPFEVKGQGMHYLLMGFNGLEFYNKRKVVDVLSFDAATGKPVFGAPVFIRDSMPALPEQRLVFEYNAEASVKANWDEHYQMVLFDHLIYLPSPFGRGITAVPDGSYDGLKARKDGRWQFVSKVFNDVMDEEFRPEPVLDKKQEAGRDVNGNVIKRKKTEAVKQR